MTVARRLLLGGALATAAGLAIAATSPVVGTGDLGRLHAQQSAGGALVVVGWALLAWGVHRFGRET